MKSTLGLLYTVVAASTVLAAPFAEQDQPVPSSSSSAQAASVLGNSPPLSTGDVPGPSNNGTGSSAADAGFLYGINIGNWLVLERWMDSSNLFSGPFSDVQDQWNFDQVEGAEEALQKHWGSWFIEEDVKKLAGWGFNALRIPIGYWAYEKFDDPYIQGADEHMEKALGWARSAGMKVLVDMHGSPGSQNGQDHSGHSGEVQWQQNDNLNKSTQALLKIAEKYGKNEWKDVVWSIQTVNEPRPGDPNNFEVSKSWSKDAYDAIMAVVENKDIQIYTHDSFLGPKNFIDISQGLKTFGVDVHNYQLYTDEDNALDQAGHVEKACGWANDMRDTKAAMPVIVGEWSCVSNVCVSGDGSTWAGTSCEGDDCQCTSANPSEWKDATKDAARQYIEAQLDVFQESSVGYFVWSYKGPGAWGPENLIENGVFPQPPTDRKFPGQCGGQ